MSKHKVEIINKLKKTLVEFIFDQPTYYVEITGERLPKDVVVFDSNGYGHYYIPEETVRKKIYSLQVLPCHEATKLNNGKCFGLSHIGDDEPLDKCKECTKFGGFNEE